MPSRRSPARSGGARPEPLFKPPPEQQPLAARMRPRSLDEFVGQEHLVGERGPLRRSVSRGVLTSILLPGYGFLRAGGGVNWGQKLAASLGAGLYEELVFRLLLTGGLIRLFRRLNWNEGPAVAGAVAGSSFLFSLFHYVGPTAEAFALGSFTFRFVAGGVLAVLYFARGFGIAAWTHALYDVFLLLAGRA